MNREAYDNFNLIEITKSIQTFKSLQEKGSIVFGAAGHMGKGITVSLNRSNISTFPQDISEELLKKAQEEIKTWNEKALKARKLSQKQFDFINKKKLLKDPIVFPENNKIPGVQISEEARNFIDKTFQDKAVKKEFINSMLFEEVGPENIPFKQNTFNFFSKILPENAILATNTSSLTVEEIAAKVENKSRVALLHFFDPSDRHPLVEIGAAPETSIETIQILYNLVISMGKLPIIAWKDSPGAIANRILVGVLNEAAKMSDEGLASSNTIDEIFLDTFYSEQIKVQTKKAKRQFEAAPKLCFFKDEKRFYKKIWSLEEEFKSEKDESKKQIIIGKKKAALEELEVKLRQKILYAQIVENLSPLGSFFKPANCVSRIKALAQEQVSLVREYLSEATLNPNKLLEDFKVSPYESPFKKVNSTTIETKKLVSDRLKGAYIAIAQQIFKEGLGTIQDIELACYEGFKYNIGPFRLAYNLGKEKVYQLVKLINKNLDQETTTGIIKSEEIYEVSEFDISGIQTYIQNDVGFILMGRKHLQNLQIMQNSLGPEMLNGISKALKDLQNKNVKAIIFKSQGGGAFSSGADLNYIKSTKWNTEKILAFRNLGKRVIEEVANCKIPTTAIIDGPAVGGGLELALACDYRVITDLAFVAMPEVGLGIIPDWGGTERLPATVGKELAKRMICTATLQNLGLKLGGEDCHKVGLADSFIAQNELPVFISSIVEGSTKDLNIFVKPPKKQNFNKTDYPETVVKRFGLNKTFKHTNRLITKQAAIFAEALINNSDNPEYAKKENTDNAFKKLICSGKSVSSIYIEPFINAAQNKFWAPLFEKIGLL